MSNLAENARQQLEEARRTANEASEHAQSNLSILYHHYLKAQMEMVKGIGEVIEHEISRTTKKPAKPAARSTKAKTAASST